MNVEHLFDEAAQPSDDQIKSISQLAFRQRTLQNKIEQMEQQIKTLQRDLKQVQEKDLPEALLAAGCRKYVLSDGTSVEVKDGISASLSEERRVAACDWLKENGYGDIVKEDVGVSFGRGEEKKASELVHALAASGLPVTRKTNVNTSTLKALIREELERGKDMPLDLLGAHRWTKAVIK